MDSEEGARKALDLARRHLESGDAASAKRLALKSQKLAASAAASALLKEIEALEENPGLRHRHSAGAGATSNGTASSSAESSSRASATSRPKAESSSSSSRGHTPQQAAVVKRIIGCSKTAYYEILSIEKTSSDGDIKKAYRKHSLSVHPDKNSAPGADEAFKLVSTAFQVLSDPDKRAHYDRYGTDPDSRGSAASASPFGPGFTSSRGPGMRGQEVSPEDLFNMFFGGGGGASPFGGPGFGSGFGGPGVQTFTFGPGGFRSSRNGAGTAFNRPRQGGGARQGEQATPAWLQMLPVICLVAFMFLSQIPSLFTSPPPPDPAYSFEPTVRHTLHRQTQNLKADYYVNKPDYVQSHVFQQLKEANPNLHQQLDNLDRHTSPVFTPVAPEGDQTPKTWSAPKFPRAFKEFEGRIENQLLHLLQLRCENESDRRARQMQQAAGFFGVGRDEARLKELREQKMPACDKLESFGYRVSRRF